MSEAMNRMISFIQEQRIKYSLSGYLLQPVPNLSICVSQCALCVSNTHTRSVPFSRLLFFGPTMSCAIRLLVRACFAHFYPHSNTNQSITLNWNQQSVPMVWCRMLCSCRLCAYDNSLHRQQSSFPSNTRSFRPTRFPSYTVRARPMLVGERCAR